MLRFLRSERGQGLIEYALVLFLVVVGAVILLSGIGTRLKDIFTQIKNTLDSTTP